MQIIPSGAFSGLGGLQRLRILGEAEAGSSDAAAPPSLQPDTFRQLSGLASLDLTGNGLASLPRGTFCHVANLRSLNLSRNSVNQLTDIGKKKKSRNLDKVFLFKSCFFPLGGECCAVPLCALPQEMDYGAGGGGGDVEEVIWQLGLASLFFSIIAPLHDRRLGGGGGRKGTVSEAAVLKRLVLASYGLAD